MVWSSDGTAARALGRRLSTYAPAAQGRQGRATSRSTLPVVP